MKGVIFNLLEEIVRDEFGEDTWDALLAAAKLDGAYTSLGNYPDEDLTRIVMAAAAALKKEPQEIVRWAGERAAPKFAQRYPKFFSAHTSARSFVLTLNEIIHPEVRKIYPGANVPVFEFDTRSEATLVVFYSSARKLCAFAEGLVTGVAAHYGEEARIEHPRCMHRGDAKCELRLSFNKRG